ncbi:helix-turn-helix transcriptional regulator [Phenylobacterium sp. VNQ135]|uniref:helix-turn-helix transcriptional regulator n=1 Tax=Phenylobacterium sp. VNQ135 TaxID=3400922 RepID=UPI003C064099
MPELTDNQAYTPALEPSFAVAEGIAALFAPFVEVAIHDLASESVAYIANPQSRRTPGDPSQLEDLNFDPKQQVIGPYEKTNWDGRRMKCVSVVLRDAGAPIGLMCINVDVSSFDQVRRALDGFLGAPPQDEGVRALFVHDWHERINRFVTDWCAERKVQISEIDRPSRRELIRGLQGIGAFEARRAPAYVARILGVSRATVYNELGALRQDSKSA